MQESCSLTAVSAPLRKAYSASMAVTYARMAALRRPQTSASSLSLTSRGRPQDIDDATRRRSPFPRRGEQLVNLGPVAINSTSMQLCLVRRCVCLRDCSYSINAKVLVADVSNWIDAVILRTPHKLLEMGWTKPSAVHMQPRGFPRA